MSGDPICLHPEEAREPLPYMGHPPDPDEWECGECGYWKMADERATVTMGLNGGHVLPESTMHIVVGQNGRATPFPAGALKSFQLVTGEMVQDAQGMAEALTRLTRSATITMTASAEGVAEIFKKLSDDLDAKMSIEVEDTFLNGRRPRVKIEADVRRVKDSDLPAVALNMERTIQLTRAREAEWRMSHETMVRLDRAHANGRNAWAAIPATQGAYRSGGPLYNVFGVPAVLAGPPGLIALTLVPEPEVAPWVSFR